MDTKVTLSVGDVATLYHDGTGCYYKARVERVMTDADMVAEIYGSAQEQPPFRAHKLSDAEGYIVQYLSNGRWFDRTNSYCAAEQEAWAIANSLNLNFKKE
jgi:hypothetical protein